MVDTKDLKSFEQKRSCGFDSHLWYNCNDSEMNDGTDAKNEMETWASPDTNRTDITTLYAGVAERAFPLGSKP